MVTIKRKLYRRGSSYETTIPMPLLFSIDPEQKHYVRFNYDKRSNRWYVDFEEMGQTIKKNKTKARRKRKR